MFTPALRRVFTNNRCARHSNMENKPIFYQFSSPIFPIIKPQQGFLTGVVSEKPEGITRNWLPITYWHAIFSPQFWVDSWPFSLLLSVEGQLAQVWAVTGDNWFIVLIMAWFLSILLLENLQLVSFQMICANRWLT